MILFYHFFLFSLTCVVSLFWLHWLWFLFLVLRWHWYHWMKSSLIIAVKCYVNFILNTTLAASIQVLVHVFLLLFRSLPISKYLEIFMIFWLLVLLQYLFSQKIYSKWIQFYFKNWELFFWSRYFHVQFCIWVKCSINFSEIKLAASVVLVFCISLEIIYLLVWSVIERILKYSTIILDLSSSLCNSIR